MCGIHPRRNRSRPFRSLKFEFSEEDECGEVVVEVNFQFALWPEFFFRVFFVWTMVLSLFSLTPSGVCLREFGLRRHFGSRVASLTSNFLRRSLGPKTTNRRNVFWPPRFRSMI